MRDFGLDSSDLVKIPLGSQGKHVERTSRSMNWEEICDQFTDNQILRKDSVLSICYCHRRQYHYHHHVYHYLAVYTRIVLCKQACREILLLRTQKHLSLYLQTIYAGKRIKNFISVGEIMIHISTLNVRSLNSLFHWFLIRRTI